MRYLSLAVYGLLLCTAALNAAADEITSPLTLAEAERLALEGDPLTRRYDAQAQAYAEQAVADAQWPDPSLSLGVQDLPTENFSATQDDFTMLKLGVSQAIPPGATLRYRAEQSEALSESEAARAEEQKRKLLNDLRAGWLEWVYQTRAIETVQNSRALLQQLAHVTQSQYGAGLASAQDLLGAELELRLLKEREAALHAARDTARADIARWLGQHSLSRALAGEFPTLPEPDNRVTLAAQLERHPLMQVEDAMVRVGESEIGMARERYKPAWGLGIDYGLRGAGRSDFISAGVTVELPIFTGKRQDRRLAASRQQVQAARYEREDRRRELLHRLDTAYAQWNGLSERVAIYENEILPQAAQNAELALKSYQSNAGDFAGVMRARITALEAQLEVLRLRVERAKAQANLLYISGERT